MKRNWGKVIFALGLLAVLGSGLFYLYGKSQRGKIPELSFKEGLKITTEKNPRGVITVGVISNGKKSYRVYDENGRELPKVPHVYEIGSLTKTFTAELVARGVKEGKIDLGATLDRYLPLPKGREYPTVEELLTHTSGYKSYYFERPMISNFFSGRNSFYAVTGEMVLKRAGKVRRNGEGNNFSYSNFGYALLGLVLESVYHRDYPSLMEEFLQGDLGLYETKLSDGTGDLGKYWDWKEGDGYLPAGGLTSTIEDILDYADFQLEHPSLCHEERKTISEAPKAYEEMGIHMDAIGLSFIVDRRNHLLWHNGGTGNYNCYLALDLESRRAVAVLSNLPPNYRIPATILGIKKMEELKKLDEGTKSPSD